MVPKEGFGNSSEKAEFVVTEGRGGGRKKIKVVVFPYWDLSCWEIRDGRNHHGNSGV